MTCDSRMPAVTVGARRGPAVPLPCGPSADQGHFAMPELRQPQLAQTGARWMLRKGSAPLRLLLLSAGYRAALA